MGRTASPNIEGALIIRIGFGVHYTIGFGVHYTIMIIRNPQDPILIIKAPA